MFDAVLSADSAKDVPTGGAASRAVGKLKAVVGQDRVDLVGHGLEEAPKKVGRRDLVHRGVKFRKDELAGAINTHKKVNLPLLGADLGDVDMKEANGVGLEGFARRLVAFDGSKARDAMALETAMEGGARQARNAGFGGVEAVVEGEQREPAEGHGGSFFLGGEDD